MSCVRWVNTMACCSAVNAIAEVVSVIAAASGCKILNVASRKFEIRLVDLMKFIFGSVRVEINCYGSIRSFYVVAIIICVGGGQRASAG